MSDYYSILGVSKNATKDEVKKAFRKKAHELHPDKGGGDDKAFKEVNEAYQVLGDDKKRQNYDQLGHANYQNTGGQGFGGGQGSGFGGFGNGFEGVNINFDDFGDLGDVIGNMFGGRQSGSSRSVRGRDVETTVTIEFMDAFRGIQKELRLRMNVACKDCDGSGAEKGSKRVSCEPCHGQGKVMRLQQTPFGAFQTAATCSKCEGVGSTPEKICSSCKGKGITNSEKVIHIDIPQGIDNGETIRVNGAGESASYGGASGDLYVHVRVKADSRFDRQGNDIRTVSYAPMSLFSLGGTTSIETVDENVELHVPAGAVSGTEFKIKGKGFSSLHGKGRGDHFVILHPEIPKKLNKEQKEILEQMKNLGL